MMGTFVERACEIIRERQFSAGGFAYRASGTFRADATCWGILALTASGMPASAFDGSLRYLADVQEKDGRVCVASQYRDAFWPTPLAMLAWHTSGVYREREAKAGRFLLDSDKLRLADDPDGLAIVGHDPTIKGWPWIEDTSPWLEPTAYCLMALRLAGFEGQARTQEARRLIIDRQLASGGWNYGNTTVYGQELRPMPETTGVALAAAAGMVPREEVGNSIEYLRSQLEHLRTPFSLAWAILGLSAWEEIPGGDQFLQRLVDQSQKWQDWDTVSLSLLVLAWHCEKGLVDWLGQTRQEARS